METLSDALVWDGTAYSLSEDELLEEDRWAMLLNQEGQVVWSLRKPEDVPEQYTVSDVASFTRWYLSDYPVQSWVREDGLLVVGSPKGSIWKHDIAMSAQTLLQIPIWFLAFFLLALGGVLGLAWLAVGRWFRQNQQVRDAARSNWINGVSHDIRTPLSVVMGYLELLRQLRGGDFFSLKQDGQNADEPLHLHGSHRLSDFCLYYSTGTGQQSVMFLLPCSFHHSWVQ